MAQTLKLGLGACALMLALGLARPPAAHSHALLAHSNPPANAELSRAPAYIELFFTEPLQPQLSTVRVLNAQGVAVDNGDARVDSLDPTRLQITLRSLPDGVYTVDWRVVSALDDHLTRGAFPFAVGQADLSAAAPATQQGNAVSGWALAHRWVTYVAVLVLWGGALFYLWVWRAPLLPFTQLVMQGAVLAGLAAHALALLTQIGQAQSLPLGAPWEPAAYAVLFDTRFGLLWLVRLAVWLALAGLAVRPHLSPAALAGLAGLLIGVLSLSGHGAAQPNPAWPMLNTAVHVAAMAAWLGGLLWLTLAWWLARAQAVLAVPRFSALALVSVAALILSGGYAALVQVESVNALVTTLYGQMLLAKLALTGLMLALGAANLLVITPRLAGEPPNPWLAMLGRTLRGELGVAAMTLAVVGALATTPPARTPNATLTHTQTIAGLTVTLTAQPGRPGLNTFRVQLAEAGQPVTDPREVKLRFTALTADLAPSDLQLLAEGNGVFGGRGGNLSQPADWQVQVIVRRPNRFDVYANVTVPLAPPAAWPWRTLSAGVLALTAGLVLVVLAPRPTWLMLAGAPLALALIGTAWVTATTIPVPPTLGPVNPVPPNAASVARGADVYTQHCAACHGPQGKGDGPVGLSLNPRPADLTQHAVPGVHTDGQLYLWITNGFPNSVMPAYETILSATDRWHVVNFMRQTLAQYSNR